VRYRPPDGTYLAWLDCRDLAIGDDPGAVFLERGRVALVEGRRCGEAGFARLNFATPRPVLVEIVDRMAAAVGR
jgi:cystathionine beta-lyase